MLHKKLIISIVKKIFHHPQKGFNYEPESDVVNVIFSKSIANQLPDIVLFAPSTHIRITGVTCVKLTQS